MATDDQLASTPSVKKRSVSRKHRILNRSQTLVNTSSSKLPSLLSKSSDFVETAHFKRYRPQQKDILNKSPPSKIERQTTNTITQTRLPPLNTSSNDQNNKQRSDFQRRQIYALNHLMRELEQEKFRQFCKSNGIGTENAEEIVVVVVDDEEDINKQSTTPPHYSSDGYNLTIPRTEPQLNAAVPQRFTELYFEIYSRLVDRSNRNAPCSIHVFIDGQSKSTFWGLAVDTKMLINTRRLRRSSSYPRYYDIFLHELTYLVQQYTTRNLADVKWLGKGLADYVRYTYGASNVDPE